MPTVTAVEQEGRRIAVTLAELPVIPATGPYPATPWTLWRVDGATETAVRGAVERPLTDSPGTVVYDREEPLNRPFAYVLRYVDADTGAVAVYSEWLTVAASLPILSDPITGEPVDVTVVEWPEVKRSARSSVFDVAGRDTPYVVVDRMGGASSSPVLRTITPTQRAAMRALLQTGQTLYLRSACAGLDDTYMLVSSVSEVRITNRAADIRRRWNCEVFNVAMPDPSITATGDTLADLAAAVPGTLADIAATWDTLLQIAAADLGGA